VKRLEVVGVRVEVPSNQPIVLLREQGGERFLPIWIGAVEATAIAFASGGVQPPRPLTHDLFRDVIIGLGATLTAVELTEIKDGVFYAELLLTSTNGEHRISARPSDAIALAVRTESPIFASDELLAEAGIEIAEQAEDEVEKFREFLDQVSPDDFLG
jgi:bifunctional DNase/RNase